MFPVGICTAGRKAGGASDRCQTGQRLAQARGWPSARDLEELVHSRTLQGGAKHPVVRRSILANRRLRSVRLCVSGLTEGAAFASSVQGVDEQLGRQFQCVEFLKRSPKFDRLEQLGKIIVNVREIVVQSPERIQQLLILRHIVHEPVPGMCFWI